VSAAAPRFVYGPVPSRRLGRSLGVDLVPFKTCTYDCIYCQLGRSTLKTTAAVATVPIDAVLGELREALARGPAPDFIGLAGSGEPTLHPDLGALIEGIKGLTAVPVAVLTNGSLLWRPAVREALAAANLVLPSLDAGDAATFARVNRPHPDITFDLMVAGQIDFAAGYPGEIWLEVFVLAGITDQPAALARIAGIAARLHPARVQLNTATRPVAAREARRVPAPRLARLCAQFSGPCEAIADAACHPPSVADAGADSAAAILALLARRPCTLAGIAAGLSLRPNAVLKALSALDAQGQLRQVRRGGAVYYEPAREA